MMRISQTGLDLIREFEGEELTVYADPVGLATVGVGHLVLKADGLKIGDKITPEQSREFLRSDVRKSEESVNDLVTAPIDQNQFDALVSLVFNIGHGAFKRSSVLRHLNARLYSKAADAFLMWTKARKNGVLVELKGLVRRRNAERELFNKR